MKILSKITLFLLIIIILTAVVIYFFVYNSSKISLQKSIGKNQLVLATETQDKIDRALYRAYTDIQIIAGFDELQDYLNSSKNISDERLLNRLNEFTIYTGPWDILSVVNKSSKVVLSNYDGEIGEDISEDPMNYLAFNRSLNGEIYYSDVIFSEETGKPTVIYYAPIVEKNTPGRPVVGVIIGHFSWPYIIDILNGVQGPLVTLYTNEGIVIGTNDPILQKKVLKTNHADSVSFKNAISSNGDSVGIYPSIISNFESLTSHVHQKGYMGYRGYGWLLILEDPTSVAFAPSYSLRNTLIIIISIIGILFFFIIFIASRSLTGSINNIYSAAKKIQDRDYSFRLDIKSKDEFEELGKVINETIEKLEKLDSERKQIDKTKSEFLNIVSHELKTPLTVIYAYLDILDDTKSEFTQDNLKALATIRRNSDRLKELINNILERSRIDSGKFELVYSEVNIKESINKILDNLKIIAERFNSKLIVNLNNAPQSLITDAQRFEEILNNLISNAIKFSQKGVVKIIVSEKKEYVLFKVIDNGIGIPKDKINNLFQKFYQVDSSISRKFEGSGLGLSITKNMIELEGGKIWVDSIEGKGSTFYFTLPKKPKNPPTKMPE